MTENAGKRMPHPWAVMMDVFPSHLKPYSEPLGVAATKNEALELISRNKAHGTYRREYRLCHAQWQELGTVDSVEEREP